jgi:hypothetical protein
VELNTAAQQAVAPDSARGLAGARALYCFASRASRVNRRSVSRLVKPLSLILALLLTSACATEDVRLCRSYPVSPMPEHHKIHAVYIRSFSAPGLLRRRALESELRRWGFSVAPSASVADVLIDYSLGPPWFVDQGPASGDEWRYSDLQLEVFGPDNSAWITSTIVSTTPECWAVKFIADLRSPAAN